MKIFLLAIVSLTIAVGSVFAGEKTTWHEFKPRCTTAKNNMHREIDHGTLEQLLAKTGHFQDRVEILTSSILTTNGSYTDHVVPDFGALLSLYETKIGQAKSDRDRGTAFREEVTHLIGTLRELDRQIATFTNQRHTNSAFETYLTTKLGHTPSDAEKTVDEWLVFVEQNKLNPQGFFSKDLVTLGAGRNFETYHQNEIAFLEAIQNRGTNTTLSPDGYAIFKNELPGMLASAYSHIASGKTHLQSSR